MPGRFYNCAMPADAPASLSPAARRSLKARAHSLRPVVMIGSAAVTDTVVAELERAIGKHELVKIRVLQADRAGREELLTQICARTGAQAVQHLGRVLTVFRKKPDPPAPPTRSGRE